MKNIYETPTKDDFLKVDFLRLIHPDMAQFSIAQYKKGAVNLKAVIDYREFNENIAIFDDSRNQEYTLAMDAWTKKMQEKEAEAKESELPVFPMSGVINMMGQSNRQPQPPVKNVLLIGTAVIYHNAQERIIMLPLEDWEREYFSYLEKQRLDISY